jgi:Tfp pilus assembly protein PilP
MRWAEHVACVGERKGVYRVLVGKSEGRPLGRTRHIREDNINIIFTFMVPCIIIHKIE